MSSSIFQNKSLRDVIPDSGEKAVRQIYKANPNVCLVFTRSFNGNVVCLEVQTNKSCTNIESIFCYWLNLEESYRRKREVGDKKKYEYENLKPLEKKMAFQFVTQDSLPTPVVFPNIPYADCISKKFIHFTKFKKKKFLVQLEIKKDDKCSINCCTYASADKKPPFVYNIKVLNLHAIVVKKAGIPVVKEVIMHGYNIDTHQPVTEKFKKNGDE